MPLLAKHFLYLPAISSLIQKLFIYRNAFATAT